jgi:site-specific DNA-methyltransferase (adenine-specific)
MVIELLNIDCMDFMATCKDKQFDLAIVDPPYGIGKDGQKQTTGGHGGRKGYDFKDWDNKIPDKQYFDELRRISTNQIIWGANYYPQFLFTSMGWVVWDKGQDINQSDGELAYTSFNCKLRIYRMNRVELLLEGTIHPTQKPIKLYKKILRDYAKPTDKIIDTHLGSGSSAIAAYDFGCDFVGMEIDKDYFDAAKKRFDIHKMQLQIF